MLTKTSNISLKTYKCECTIDVIRRDKTVLFITAHNLDSAKKLASKYLPNREGRIDKVELSDRSLDEYFSIAKNSIRNYINNNYRHIDCKNERDYGDPCSESDTCTQCKDIKATSFNIPVYEEAMFNKYVKGTFEIYGQDFDFYFNLYEPRLDISFLISGEDPDYIVTSFDEFMLDFEHIYPIE